jgi:hypothetical protein
MGFADRQLRNRRKAEVLQEIGIDFIDKTL